MDDDTAPNEGSIGSSGAGEDGGGQVVTLDRRGDRLTPFRKGDGRASAAGKRGAASKAAKRATQRRDSAAVAAHLATLRATYQRDALGPTAAAVAADLLGRIAAGEVPVRNGDEAASLLRVLVDVARIEAGEATTASIVAHLGADATARVLALRDEARAALSTTSAAECSAADAASPDAGSSAPIEVHEAGDGGVTG